MTGVSADAENVPVTSEVHGPVTNDSKLPFIIAMSSLTAVVIWSFWPAFVAAETRWQSDPQYSHGFLVPPFAAYLLWSGRNLVLNGPLFPSLWGFAGLAAGVGIRAAGTRYFINGLDLLATIPILLGAAVLLAGRTGFRWAVMPTGFLVFMIPLPYKLQAMLSGQLQQIGTTISTFLLQTLGLPAIAEGNVIVIDQTRIGVVEACSGLGMIVTCAALATAMALLVKSPLWIKVCLVLAALPISVATNVARISATAFLHHVDRSSTADTLYHDLAGWFMMPLALAMIGLTRLYLVRIVVDYSPPGLKSVPLPLTAAGPV